MTADTRTPDTASTEKRFPIEQLLSAPAYSHPVKRLRCIETHISWIVLTGEFAYKIKKPVQFDFVDYSTLEKRNLNCNKEVQLNRRYAPDIYLDVVPIYDQSGRFHVGLSNNAPLSTEHHKVVEYAVRMKEFSQDFILANRVPKVTGDQLENFALRLSAFHRQESAVEIEDIDQELAKVKAEVSDNFSLLRKALKDSPQLDSIERIEAWSESEFSKLMPQIAERIRQGKIKLCHGDLHLNNIIELDGELIPFDGIEFNQHLQNIDTLSEVAFLFMDLDAHGYRGLAWRFLNAYLEDTGENDCLELFRFFAVYRAMVRAKVAWIQCQLKSNKVGHQGSWLKGDEPVNCQEPVHPWDHYLDFSERMIATRKPHLSITFGFSGSGKSTTALGQVESHEAIRIRSDVLRKKLHAADPGQYRYSTSLTEQVYRQMLQSAECILQAGVSVVLDATFLNHTYREWFLELATRQNANFQILACDANFAELCSRIQERSNDPSEATIKVLQQQMNDFDELTEMERQYVKAD